MTTDRTYTRKQAENITGMTSIQIRSAGDQGLLSLGHRFPGRGNARLYTWTNLLELKIIKELKKYGVELAAIRVWMDTIRQGLRGVNRDDYFIDRIEDPVGGVAAAPNPITYIIIRTTKNSQLKYGATISFETGTHSYDDYFAGAFPNKTKDNIEIIGDRKFLEIDDAKSGIFINVDLLALSLVG